MSSSSSSSCARCRREIVVGDKVFWFDDKPVAHGLVKPKELYCSQGCMDAAVKELKA